jgi:hypothetical protein
MIGPDFFGAHMQCLREGKKQSKTSLQAAPQPPDKRKHV